MISNNKNRSKGAGKAGARKNENARIYANPLPLLFPEPAPSRMSSLIGLLGLSLAPIQNPHCTGIFDRATRSVWICNSRDSMILWQRGMFGKGDLSRSEPSWFQRQTNLKTMGGKQLTSEEVTSKRRAERKQFKLDRAKAIADALAEAEAAFEQGVVMRPALSGPNIPSAATWKPSPAVDQTPFDGQPAEAETEQDLIDARPLEDIEHLQLTLVEAFFLLWNLDCLAIIDPQTDAAMTLKQVWAEFQFVHADGPDPGRPFSFSPDNPFIIDYVAYHHFRALGWVVKGGIKFCVDYLLYKKGPVFAHAEFAVVVCPVYEDTRDEEESTFVQQNAQPFSWTWLSTINRVNTQVQKTLILAYVTIPARRRLLGTRQGGTGILKEYSVREVVVRRFIPARMRE